MPATRVTTRPSCEGSGTHAPGLAARGRAGDLEAITDRDDCGEDLPVVVRVEPHAGNRGQGTGREVPRTADGETPRQCTQLRKFALGEPDEPEQATGERLDRMIWRLIVGEICGAGSKRRVHRSTESEWRSLRSDRLSTNGIWASPLTSRLP